MVMFEFLKLRHMSPRALKFSRFSCGGRQKRGRKGTKSHANVIFHLFVGKPPV